MNANARKVIAEAISAIVERDPHQTTIKTMELLVEEIIYRDSMDPDEQARFRREIEW